MMLGGERVLGDPLRIVWLRYGARPSCHRMKV
jgi:hypothetical protein